MFVACGGDSSNALVGLVCGSGHAKGKMTVGLNLDLIKGTLGLAEKDSAVSDVDLKSFLNQGLNKAGVSESLLSVKSVSSIKETDPVRFLQLDGLFGEGFGVATKLLKDNKDKFGLHANASPFEFINESFDVAVATHFITADSPNDDQWAYRQTEYDKALTLFEKMKAAAGDESQASVTVAVLDTGVDLDHPDLKDVLVEGYDALGTDTGVDDENGHGTHCAGIIGAEAKSDESALGVARMANVKIMPVKVLGKNGGGDFQAIEKGIRKAMDSGVDVISLSLGAGLEYTDMGGNIEALQNGVIKDAIDKGFIVIVAAGNESCKIGGECQGSGLFSKSFDEYTVVPCAYENTICIGATDADETLASYSNYSSKKEADYRTKADVNAPGTAIYSTWPGGGYKTISGTSMATPYVAGIAAIMKSIDKNLTQTQILDYLRRGQSKPTDVVNKSETGRADLYATLVALANDKGIAGVEAEFTPEAKPVEAPETEAGNTGDIASLLSAVCR